MAEQDQQSNPEKSLGNSISDVKTSYDRIKRVRFIGNIAQTGIRFLFGGIGIPFLVTILFVAGATFGLLFLNPDVVSGGTPGTPGADCVADLGGSCDTGPTCASPKVQDTTGATCTDNTKICCVAAKACADPSVGGKCSIDSTCASVTPPSIPDTTHAACDPAASGMAQTCCVPKKTCESIGGKCSPDATCASVTPPSTPDTTHAVCTPETDTCCIPKNVSCDADPANALKQNYNVEVSTTNKSQLTEICNILAIPARSSTYKGLLKTGGAVLNIQLIFDSSGCHGYTSNSNSVQIYNLNTCGAAVDQYILIHETGHIIRSRNYVNYPYDTLVGTDASCYSNGFLVSYRLRVGSAGTANAESFAESVADYVTYATYAPSAPGIALRNFPTQCPATYNWVKNTIYGGTTF